VRLSQTTCGANTPTFTQQALPISIYSQAKGRGWKMMKQKQVYAFCEFSATAAFRFALLTIGVGKQVEVE
jgi:hypothetical protein